MDLLPPRQFAEEIVDLFLGLVKVVIALVVLAFLVGGIVGLCVIGWHAL